MSRTVYILIVLLLMGLVGFYVRAGRDRTEPPAQMGPPTPASHDVSGAHANCLACHGNIVSSHDTMFGEGNYDDCLGCHPQN